MKQRSRSRKWLLVHSWLAVPVWALMFFVCLTGTIATVSNEILWLVSPAVRANPPSAHAELLGYDKLVSNVQRALPGAVVTRLSPEKGPLFATEVDVATADFQRAVLYVNPYTGAIQGTKSSFDFPEFVRALHGWLLVPWTGNYNVGAYLVCFLALPLLGSLATGLVVYKKFWRGFLRPRLRLRNGARIFWGDFHRLAGVWSIPFIAIIGVTALWFLADLVLWNLGVSPYERKLPPAISREDVPTLPTGNSAARIGADRAVSSVSAGRNLDIEYATVPTSTYEYYVIRARSAFPLLSDDYFVNPYTGNLDRSPADIEEPAAQKIMKSMYPLHFGDFAGIWLKIVYFFLGMVLTALVLSGFLVWTKRTVLETAKVIGIGRSMTPGRRG